MAANMALRPRIEGLKDFGFKAQRFVRSGFRVPGLKR